ncbi:hypothetical protein [Olsenella sp. DNF00959]|uniref:hypothetical protein n=1 Tax=Olsenella sp. DNF00959 TaxID=1476999 RepID=UPI0007802716|nr:hypothetical protein [Olsenella sp. DNF00959]KXB62485.1 hypothetical protein HMPREF1868_01147 [Olsenella sp. DNF00959]
MCASGKVTSPQPGYFARKATWDGLDALDRCRWTMRGMCARHPRWVFCEASAAIAHGLSVSWREADVLHLATSLTAPVASRTGLRRHPIRPGRVMVVDDMRVTSPERCAFDCLRRMGFRDGLALADSYLRKTGMDRDAFMDQIVAHHHGERDIGRALSIARHADGRAESGGESIARATMIELGFELPELQAEVPDPFAPGRDYRVDFLWTLPDGNRVAGELDGREKYVNPQMTKGRSAIEVLAAERLRESRLSATGAAVMRFSYADVLDIAFFKQLLDRFGIPRDHDTNAGRAHRRRYKERWQRTCIGTWLLNTRRIWPPRRRARDARHS